MSLAEVWLVPPTVVTVTSTWPAVAVLGTVTVSEVAVGVPVTVAVVVPNFTVSFAAVVSKPVPVIVRLVPPASGPELELSDVTVGVAA